MGDDAVSEENDLVCPRERPATTCVERSVRTHPVGQPITHSTNDGLRCPPPIPVRAPRCNDPREVGSVREGVSIPRTATSVSVAPAWRPLSFVQFPATPPALASFAVGVGMFPRARSAAIAGLSSDSSNVAGEEVEPIADVRGADGTRGDTVPFRSPPARGQRVDDLAERGASVDGEDPGDVFEEHPRSSAVGDDAPELGPQPSFVLGAELVSGAAVPLARDARKDEIHEATELSAVEGFQIVPHRTRSHGALDHAMAEDGCCVCTPLDSTHNAKSGQSNGSPELQSSASSADSERGSRSGAISHTDHTPRPASFSTIDVGASGRSNRTRPHGMNG